MSHSRTKPTGWSVNEKLTSAQINDLDIKSFNSLDKSAAGDAIEGPVTVAASASIEFDLGSTLDVSGDAFIRGDATITGAGAKLSTASSGRIELGDDDFPLLASGHISRSITRIYTAAGVHAYGGTVDVDAVDVATGAALVVFVPPMHDGATLSSVSVRWVPNASHSGLPGTNVRVNVTRKAYAVGAATAGQSLSSGGAVYYTPVSLPNLNDGTIKQLVFTCNQNNVIDRSLYAYFVEFYGEDSTDAMACEVRAMALDFTTITDMRFA